MEEAYEYSWPEQFYYFALFRTLNGPDAAPGKDCDAPIDNDTYYTQAALCIWIREQNHSRKAFLDGDVSDLTANQIKVLDGVGFPWLRDSSERWDGHFQELVEYKEKHGHCNVPPRSCKLGIWVKNQRAAYHKLCDIAAGREMVPNVKRTTAVITPDQIKLLDDIGFQWKLREDFGIAWDRHFENLKAFKEQHGHTRVSPKEIPALGQWVAKQRRHYKNKAKGEKSRITEEQFARLNEIGFEWQRPTVNPEERQRRKQETRRKMNERKKRMRQEAKLRKREEAEAALKEYRPRAKTQRTDDASPMEKSAAKAPKKGARRKSLGEKVKGRARKPDSKDWNVILRTTALTPSVPPTKNDIDQRLAELRREEEGRARKLQKIVEDRRRSGRMVVSRIVKLAAGAPMDEGAVDGEEGDLAGENMPTDEETGESPRGSTTSSTVKLAAGAPADEGSEDEARNGIEEKVNQAQENIPMDEGVGMSAPGSAASNTAKLAAGALADEDSADEARNWTEEWA